MFKCWANGADNGPAVKYHCIANMGIWLLWPVDRRGWAVWTVTHYQGAYPANTTHLPNVWPMLGQRRRRWANIGQILGRCSVFAGYAPLRRWSVGRENIGNADSTSRRTLNRRMHSWGVGLRCVGATPQISRLLGGSRWTSVAAKWHCYW